MHHIKTEDDEVRKKQNFFKKSRGRPSIIEMDKKKDSLKKCAKQEEQAENNVKNAAKTETLKVDTKNEQKESETSDKSMPTIQVD